MSAIEAMSGFGLHFLRPWWWLALVPLPFVLWMLVKGGSGRAALARIADAALLPSLVHATGARKRVALVMAGLAWLLAVAALAGPAWQRVATPLYVNGAARVVVLSLSDDMLAQDLRPDRMTRARFAIRDLLDAAGDARMALVAYAGAAFTVAPLTDDKRTVENLLRALRPDVMPVPGNDAAAGIRQGVELLRNAHVKGGEIVLLTDTAGDAAVAAAKQARGDGIRVDVLGVGTEHGAPIPQRGGGFAMGAKGTLMASRDDAALRAVAAAGGGRYSVLQADGSGTAAFAAPVAESGHASHAQRAQLWRDGGVWLLPLLLVFAALAFRRGWLLVLALLVLPLGMPVAHAATWQSLWANRDQRALQAMQHGDAKQAKALATTSGLRGAAEYRAGDYAGAAQAFAQGHGARARYNLGNALAKQGDYQNAIAAYQQALQQDPGFTDAQSNLDAVQAWLKKHRQAKSSPSQRQGSSQQHGNRGAGEPQAQAGNGKPQQGQGASSPSSAGPARNKSGTQSNPSATSHGLTSKSGSQANDRNESAADAEQQRRQVQLAEKGLEQELHGERANKKKGSTATHAFALGQTGAHPDSKFNAEQRAMLHAVPDDPGALLRRKFQLEWEQRNGQQPEGGQP